VKSTTLNLGALLASTLVASLLVSDSTAQERSFPPLPASVDIKTPAEPSRPPDPVVPRPGIPADLMRPAGEPADPSTLSPCIDANAPVPSGFRIDHSRMHYDTPGDGSLWARGASYKASFDAAGATCFPLFGGHQPRHLPLALSPNIVSRGGVPLPIADAATPLRADDRVEIDRGSFVERYVLATQSLEQAFVFPSLVGTGDLVLRIPIAPAEETTHVVATRAGLEIRSDLGQVSYGRAVAIDGSGRRADADTSFADGAITIRVDAGFLATATMPLVIDPIVTPLVIDSTSYVNQFSDVAYDATTQRWLVVYGELATAGDQDVYYTILNAGGTSMWGGYLNANDASWWSPSCANLNAADQFLVACHVSANNTDTIRGRTVQANISSVGNEFFISGSESGGKFAPDVGGDPFPFSPSYYCVAYQREYSGSDDDILVRLVTSNSTLLGTGPVYLSNSGGTQDTNPSVAKSNNAGDWMIAWQRDLAYPNADIWAGSVTYAGVISLNPFQITSGSFDVQACVSTALTGTARTMIAFLRWYGTDWDVHAVVQDGMTPIASTDVSTLHNDAFFLENQWVPNVDSDGQHFLLGYSEQHIPGANEFSVYVDELYLAGSTIGLSQTRVPLAATSSREIGPRIASTKGSGGQLKRYLLSWTKEASSGNYDIHAALFDGTDIGSSSQFCAGDGIGGICPCGNNGASGFGCANSVNATGASLTVSGSLAPALDTAVLSAGQMPATAACLFFQGSSILLPAIFGDGLRCAGGTVIRLEPKTAVNGAAHYPGPGDPAVHVKGGVPPAGGTRTYQVWYRNAASFCTPSTFNLTNGVIINWAN
jgi:hypothetical protein